MYLMNEDKLGGYSTTKNDVRGACQVGGCWYGESYFVDPADGAARVVSRGGREVKLWKPQTSPGPKLVGVTHSPALSSLRAPYQRIFGWRRDADHLGANAAGLA
jgi:hypothetical protein